MKGHLAVRMEADCDRCLEPARFRSTRISNCFTGPWWKVSEKRTAIDRDEAEMGFYEGDGLELDDVLREFVLLSLPMQRVVQRGLQGNLSGVRAEPELERVPLPGGNGGRPLGGAEKFKRIRSNRDKK